MSPYHRSWQRAAQHRSQPSGSTEQSVSAEDSTELASCRIHGFQLSRSILSIRSPPPPGSPFIELISGAYRGVVGEPMQYRPHEWILRLSCPRFRTMKATSLPSLLHSHRFSKKLGPQSSSRCISWSHPEHLEGLCAGQVVEDSRNARTKIKSAERLYCSIASTLTTIAVTSTVAVAITITITMTITMKYVCPITLTNSLSLFILLFVLPL